MGHLIELLVVVVIIAILASLLLPGLSLAKEKAKLAACLNHQDQRYAALVMFTDDRDGVPPLVNKDTCDAETGLTGIVGDPLDPYRWVYFGMAQVWASGYFETLELLVCPGFENYVDEIAMGWQSKHIVQPGGSRELLDELLTVGQDINGIPSWNSPQGYRGGTYSLNLLDPDSSGVPKAKLKKFPRGRVDYPVQLCAQSIRNPQQAGGAWYQKGDYDCHRREAMNCTFRDGSAKSLKGVPPYAEQMYAVPDWTWQLTSTGNSWDYYWWQFAEAQY